MRAHSLTAPLLLLLAVSPVAPAQVLLIPESTNDTVQRFDPTTGAHLGVAVPPDPGNLSTPIDTAANLAGILVSDQITDAVQQYDPMGAFLFTLASPIDNLRGIAVRGGVLYCTAGNADSIPAFDLQTGAAMPDFIPAGGGGLDSPFDILFRRTGDVLVTSINTDNILQYDAAGVFIGVFATNIPFGEQLHEAANDNILVADFTRSAVIELSPVGVELAALMGVGGCRGVYELPSGNLLVTSGSGVFEIDRMVGGVVATPLMGVSARYIELHGPPGPPPPSCTAMGPAGLAGGDIPIDLDTMSASSATVDLGFDYTLDSGVTFLPCTAAATSPLPNPAAAVATGLATFEWDSRADMVGIPGPQVGVLVQISVDDGTGMATCTTLPFDVQNSACPTFCGDCDSNGMGPSILDALVAAQIAAGLIVPTAAQLACCDVDASATLTILDALLMAQAAAGLPVTLMCP